MSQDLNPVPLANKLSSLYNTPVVVCEDIYIESNDYDDLDEDGDVCEVQDDVIVFAQGLNVTEDCNGKRLFWLVKVDYWYDGIVDEVYSSFIPESDLFYLSPTEHEQNQSIELKKEFLGGEWARHVVEWKVFDACGNVSQCHQYIEVGDRQAPQIVVKEMAMADFYNAESIELFAHTYVEEVEDNCVSDEFIYFSFLEVPPLRDFIDEEHCFVPVFYDRDNCIPARDPETGLIFSEQVNCNNYNDGTRRQDCPLDCVQKWNPSGIELDGVSFKSSSIRFSDWWCGVKPIEICAWDRRFNMNFEKVDILFISYDCVIEEPNRLEGNITTELGHAVKNVKVVNYNQFYNQTVLSYDWGYKFHFNILGFNYHIVPNKTDSWINEVSVLDLIVLNKHLLDNVPFTSAYKTIAADINFDDQVDENDFIELRNILLGNSTIPDEHAPWVFIDKKQALDPINPWPLNQSITIEGLSSNHYDLDFIGVKVGDLDGSMINKTTSPNLIQRKDQSIDWIINKTDKGIQFSSSEHVSHLHGFYLDLLVFGDYDSIEIVGLEPEHLHTRKMNNDQLRIIYTPTQQHSIHKDDLLFTVKGVHSLELAQESIVSEVYTGLDFVARNISLIEYKTDSPLISLINSPNPFEEETTFTIMSSVTGTSNVNIYHVNGELVHNVEMDLKEGQNKFAISKNDLGMNGFYICQVSLGGVVITKKIVLH